MKEKIIKEFKGDYRFLSNFHPCNLKMYFVELDKIIIFPTVEHYYQAMKSENWEDWIKISKLIRAGEAKRAGRKLPIREDWEAIKLTIMDNALRIKFNMNWNKDLCFQLIETGNAELIEGNYWHDNYWGVCYCPKCQKIKGQNVLGNLLMSIRSIRSK